VLTAVAAAALAGAGLAGRGLAGADLAGADLAGADLAGAGLVGAGPCCLALKCGPSHLMWKNSAQIKKISKTNRLNSSVYWTICPYVISIIPYSAASIRADVDTI